MLFSVLELWTWRLDGALIGKYNIIPGNLHLGKEMEMFMKIKTWNESIATSNS